jgi:O-antigen ligase
MKTSDLSIQIPKKYWFAGLTIMLALSVAGAIAVDNFLLLFVPAAVLFIVWAVLDTPAIYSLYFALLPFSVETYFSNGLGTDLPTEPIMLGLTALTILYLVRNFQHVSGWIVAHPINLVLLLHLSWLTFATVFSVDTVISVKFLLAKSWYVISLFVLSWLLIDTPEKLKRILKVYLIALLIVVLYTLVNHALEGFTFIASNFVMAPFYRNHVNYGAALTIALPFIWFFYKSNKKWRWFWMLYFLILMVAVYYAYLRAAYVAMVAIVGTYYIVRWRLMKPVLVLSLIVAVFGVMQLIEEDRYLELAPDYEKTIAHKDFDDLLSATAKGEDISTMERIYRWVAGYQMIREKTWLGFGPGTFYENYKPYTVKSFETYVSDNPERSGIHSYYLMTLVEQGIPGLLIFLILVITVMVYGERLYHKLDDPVKKRWVMAVLMCYVAIAVFQIINDLVETDKIGTFFFLCMAVLSRWGSDFRISTLLAVNKGRDQP